MEFFEINLANGLTLVAEEDNGLSDFHLVMSFLFYLN